MIRVFPRYIKSEYEFLRERCLLHWQAGSLSPVPPGKPPMVVTPNGNKVSQMEQVSDMPGCKY